MRTDFCNHAHKERTARTQSVRTSPTFNIFIFYGGVGTLNGLLQKDKYYSVFMIHGCFLSVGIPNIETCYILVLPCFRPQGCGSQSSVVPERNKRECVMEENDTAENVTR